ncbi:uncharacterized protein LOC121859191 [Homarus americanus]|uniref:uncharacterized protein LOC121859191 n=1 Tax=Homarus americanus TaxID=6706 RepID=UPI001C4925E4|nr:uncharacterized protein LOC121859191 [Homarus americanus]
MMKRVSQHHITLTYSDGFPSLTVTEIVKTRRKRCSHHVIQSGVQTLDQEFGVLKEAEVCNVTGLGYHGSFIAQVNLNLGVHVLKGLGLLPMIRIECHMTTGVILTTLMWRNMLGVKQTNLYVLLRRIKSRYLPSPPSCVIKLIGRRNNFKKMRKLPHLLFLCLALATVRKTNAHRPRVEASVVQPRPTLTNTTTTAHQQYSVRSSRSLLASHDCVNCSFPLLLHIKKTDEDSVVAELMSYLITFTSGTQFYLVYDDLLPVVRKCHVNCELCKGLTFDIGVCVRRRWRVADVPGGVDTTLLPYRPTSQLLMETLKSFYHALPMRNIVVLCSPQHVITLFEEVKKNMVESPTIQWLVFIGGPDGEVARCCEGTQGNMNDSIMFGVWSADIGGNQQEELIPDLEQMYSDFQGRGCWSPPTITGPSSRSTHSTMAPSSPFLVLTFRSSLPSVTPQLHDNWGGPQPDGSITGLVGQVAERHMPHSVSSQLQVWICICVVTALVGPVLYVVSHIMIVYVGKKDHVHHSMQSLSFNMYRNLMVQNIDITSLTGAFVSSSSSGTSSVSIYMWAFRPIRAQFQFLSVFGRFFIHSISDQYVGHLTVVQVPLKYFWQVPDMHWLWYNLVKNVPPDESL